MFKLSACLAGAALLCPVFFQNLHAGEFFQDFSGSNIGDTNFSDGSQLFSTSYSVAQVVFAPYNELQLTANGIPSVTSAYELPDLDLDTPVYAFSAKWNMPVFGSFGGSPPSADGFSFNFGQFGSVNLTNGTVESGYGTGLSFDVQTYSGNSPGFYIRSGGNIIASVPYNPATEWGYNNGTRHFLEVDWNYYTGMTVRMDGTNIFSNVMITNFIPYAGDRFVFAARCGADSEFIRLDNIMVWSGYNMVPLPASPPYFSAGGEVFSSPSDAFDGNFNDFWATGSPLPTGIGATFLPTNLVFAYTVTSANLGNRAADPASWTLQGSADGNTWNYILGNGGGYFQADGETHCCPAYDGDGDLTAYRLEINTNNSSPFTALGELQLYALSTVAPPYNAFIQVSSAGSRSWEGVAASTDGTKLFATVANGGIWASTNSGATWTQTAALTKSWAGIACSSNGTQLVAVSDAIYKSSNTGASWTVIYTNLSGDTYEAIASSSDGSHLYASDGATGTLASTNGGSSWSVLIHAPYGGFRGIGCSGDGSEVVGGQFNGMIYYSLDYGATWNQGDTDNEQWTAVVVSPDGLLINAVSTTGTYVSDDDIDYFEQTSAPGWPNYGGYTISGDGSLAIGSRSSKLWIMNAVNRLTPPVTSLQQTVSGNDATFGWPVSSGGNFTLQQSAGLSPATWTNVTWPVGFGYDSQFNVTVPKAAGNAFYRLKAP